MNKACVFFKISDIVMHYPRNYKKYPDVTKIKNYVYDETIGNYGKADLFYVKGKEKYPVIVNVHGGGFVKGDKRHRSAICSEYAREGFFVYNVNYRLAPQYPLPYGSIDVLTALSRLPALAKQYDLDLNKVVLTGDSAGAFYAASATLALVNPDYAALLGVDDPDVVDKPSVVPAAFMGFCGAYRLGDILSRKTPLNVADDIAASLMGVKCGTALRPEECEKFRFTDLIKYVDEKFPKSFLLYSLHDDFCGGQGELMEQRLLTHGVSVETFVAEGEKDIHCFHLLPRHKTTPYCMRKAKAFLRSV